MKQRLVPAILLFILFTSCTEQFLGQGRVALHSGANKNSFVFAVDDSYTVKNANSPRDKKNPKMSKAESKLLTFLLKQKSYCTDKGRTPRFLITSFQEKVYDATFAHLIEENYNAKSIAPRMYFGHCL